MTSLVMAAEERVEIVDRTYRGDIAPKGKKPGGVLRACRPRAPEK